MPKTKVKPATNPREFGLLVLKALGIESARVIGFDLHVEVGELVTLTIRKIVDVPLDNSDLSSPFKSVAIGKRISSETFELNKAS